MLPLLIQLPELGHPVPILQSVSLPLLVTPPAKPLAITGGTKAEKPPPLAFHLEILPVITLELHSLGRAARLFRQVCHLRWHSTQQRGQMVPCL
jgi:hypothetical protein